MQFYNTPFVFLNSESKYMYNHALTHIIKDCLLLCRSGSMKRSQLNIVLHVIMYILSVVHVIIIIFFFRLKHRRTNGNWRGGGRGGNWRGGGRGSSDRDHESMRRCKQIRLFVQVAGTKRTLSNPNKSPDQGRLRLRQRATMNRKAKPKAKAKSEGKQTKGKNDERNSHVFKTILTFKLSWIRQTKMTHVRRGREALPKMIMRVMRIRGPNGVK